MPKIIFFFIFSIFLIKAQNKRFVYSLGASSATVWSGVAIRSAFKTVAKRMLGPIGVAIAVVDFGFCMSGVEL